ncbi:ammecr1 family [Pyrenophora seminiperda CCB06]|uniref:Ammecr1 family n=1 Tax=Pyrenophora seminiperda CCB06 TaxID=1302712 RepID=A0A3M7M6R7_9PLEO|nr:ammecr1 family [Pyrenophora seminiperda CCB06]
MATQAHCAYCFESLVASLEKRPALSLTQVQTLWAKYTSDPTTTSELEDETEQEEADALARTTVDASPYKPAAVSRILGSPPSSASSSSLQSASSTPSGGASETPNSLTSQSSTNLVSNNGDHDSDTQEEHPLFVTWNTVSSKSGDKRLRGCIGTFEALPLATGLSSYALTSAFDDTRFAPITARELRTLEVAVTLLTNFESVDSPMDWDIGTHGLRISFTDKGRRYGSTYLPDVALEQGWSKEETLVSLMRKAGWGGKKADWKKVGVRVVRYQGKKVALGWGEWTSWRDWVDEEMADV